MTNVNTPSTMQSRWYFFDNEIVKPIGNWLDRHPVVNTIVVIANHLFRAMSMVALMTFLPYSFATNCAIALGASVFYRITIERFCHFRFAMPACLGAIAWHVSQPAILQLINGAAAQSLNTLAKTLLRASPAALYLMGIVWLSYSSVQRLNKKESSKNTAEPQAPCCCS